MTLPLVLSTLQAKKQGQGYIIIQLICILLTIESSGIKALRLDEGRICLAHVTDEAG